MRMPVAPAVKKVGRFADRLLSRFRLGEPKALPLPPPGKLSNIRHAAKGSAPRYVRRHYQQAGLTITMGRFLVGPIPPTRRGHKARARVSRVLAERLAVSTRPILPRLRVADRVKP